LQINEGIKNIYSSNALGINHKITGEDEDIADHSHINDDAWWFHRHILGFCCAYFAMKLLLFILRLPPTMLRAMT
jgi:hypothetical protein